MSYLRPQWWLRPFRFLWNMQTKDLHEQLEVGCRAFDLRIVFEDNKPVFACGPARFRGTDVHQVLEWMNRISRAQVEMDKPRIICRILLEHGRGHKYVLFHDFCCLIEELYDQIQFCGFRTPDTKFFEYWFIRDGIRSGTGAGDFGSIEVRTKNSFYSSKPCSGFKLEYKLENFV